MFLEVLELEFLEELEQEILETLELVFLEVLGLTFPEMLVPLTKMVNLREFECHQMAVLKMEIQKEVALETLEQMFLETSELV